MSTKTILVVDDSKAGGANLLKAGDMILMPAGETHALRAVKRFKMVLSMIRAGEAVNN